MQLKKEKALKEARSMLETGFAMYHNGTEQFMSDLDTDALVFEYEADAIEKLLAMREFYKEDPEFEKMTRVVPVVFRIDKKG